VSSARIDWASSHGTGVKPTSITKKPRRRLALALRTIEEFIPDRMRLARQELSYRA